MKYQVQGYLKLADKQTGLIRTQIEAVSKQEAEAKFKDFVLRKAEAIVQSCQDESDLQLQDMFKSFFGK